jgi:ABC-type transport system involved in cytochrome c biogenesis permease subunit
MSWIYPSEGLLLATLVLYAVATLAFSLDHALRRLGRGERLGRVAVSLTVTAFTVHGGLLVTRGLAAGRPPLGNMFEFAISTAFAATGGYLLIGRRTGQLCQLGLLAVLPVAVTLTLAAVVLYDEPGLLVPALRSGWMSIHVTAAAVAVGAVTVGTVGCAVQLHAQHRRRADTAAAADRVTRAAYAFAFPVWTFAVTTGAIWAERAWGRFWGWDPKEIWAFVSWVVLAAYLHARRTAGVRRRTAAIVGIVAYGTLLFNFVGVNIWFDGLHSYAGL